MASYQIDLPASTVSVPPGGATSANQLLEIADLDAIKTATQSIDTKATSLSTSAKQDTANTSLSSIDTKLTSQATAAKQDTGNTSLSSIDSKFTTLNAKDFATSAKQDAEAVLIGAVTETAPATDTASSGLNGRLQRIAQRLSSLISLLPTALGQKTMAGSLAVTLASDQSTLVTSDAATTAMNTAIGAQADAVATTDTGTFSLIALIKKVAQNITAMSAQLPATLGIKTAANSLSIAPASDAVFATTSTNQTVAGTPSTAQITVGLTAVRATVSGLAPSASRKYLSVKPSKNNTGAIYIGGSGVTTANGQEIMGPDYREFIFDSGDYFIISDTASQTVEILEKV